MSELGFEIALWKYTYADKWILWFLLIIPVLIVWYIAMQNRRTNKIKISSFRNFNGFKSSPVLLINHILFGLKLLALGLLIAAFARPQNPSDISKYHEEIREGIDIVITMDVSGSMKARDFKPDRLEAAKQVALDFVDLRKNDRIGLVVYQREAYTQCPLTTDHRILKTSFDEIQSGIVQQGTSIGMGLSTAVNRLRNSEAISKVVILLTDGVDDLTSSTDPITAAQIAKEYGVRVYTIGVGKNGMAPTPHYDQLGRVVFLNAQVKIDEKTLKQIANTTDGQYFRATNKKSLKKIYEEIDKLEKSKIDVIEYEKDLPEKFFPFVLLASILLLISFIVKKTLLRGIS